MSAQSPEGPAQFPPPGSLRCPRCSATVGPEQDWCLECGAPARTRLAQTPNWQLPTVAIGAIVLLAGALLAFAFVTLTGDDGASAGTTPTAVVEAAPPAAVAPAPATTTPTTATSTAPVGPAAPATTVPGQTATTPMPATSTTGTTATTTTTTTPARTSTTPATTTQPTTTTRTTTSTTP